jgi:hypothetical protein
MKQKIEAPNYTQIPNIYFDEIMQILNQTENIVFLVIMRKTFGWHKKRDAISYSQIMSLSGIKSRSTISAALKGLQEKGLIETLKTGQLISYTVSINGLVQNIDQSKNCTGTSPNSVLVEPKTSPNSVHTKESNINKVKKNIGIKKLISDKPESVSQEVWDEYVSLRKQKRTTVTPLVIKGIEREAEKAGLSLQDALVTCIERGWQGFKADWVKEKSGNNYGAKGFRISSDNAILKEGECNF